LFEPLVDLSLSAPFSDVTTTLSVVIFSGEFPVVPSFVAESVPLFDDSIFSGLLLSFSGRSIADDDEVGDVGEPKISFSFVAWVAISEYVDVTMVGLPSGRTLTAGIQLTKPM
jgi:hypothetical protein